ncbi:MAG: hypothetical protein ABFS03_00840 [Chloroflexota bacterium]
MSKYRFAAKIDKNQPEIVAALRKIPGVTVQLGMDDILVGYKGKNHWFEIKEPETVSKKTGKVMDSKIKPSQHKLRDTWAGHYSIVWNIDQILAEIMA